MCRVGLGERSVGESLIFRGIMGWVARDHFVRVDLVQTRRVLGGRAIFSGAVGWIGPRASDPASRARRRARRTQRGQRPRKATSRPSTPQAPPRAGPLQPLRRSSTYGSPSDLFSSRQRGFMPKACIWRGAASSLQRRMQQASRRIDYHRSWPPKHSILPPCSRAVGRSRSGPALRELRAASLPALANSRFGESARCCFAP